MRTGLSEQPQRIARLSPSQSSGLVWSAGRISQHAASRSRAPQPLGAYLDAWLDGLRLAPSTSSSYRRNVRVHVSAYPIASVPLASLTPGDADRHYRMLEASGRRGSKGERTGQPLYATSVRYLHTFVSSALKAAVAAGQIPSNPAARANPPTAKQAGAPEMNLLDCGRPEPVPSVGAGALRPIPRLAPRG